MSLELGCLEKIQSEKPDLVLLDIMMPGLDGLEACRTIKQNPDTRHIKVAVFTAKTSQRDREISAEYLADAPHRQAHFNGDLG